MFCFHLMCYVYPPKMSVCMDLVVNSSIFCFSGFISGLQNCGELLRRKLSIVSLKMRMPVFSNISTATFQRILQYNVCNTRILLHVTTRTQNIILVNVYSVYLSCEYVNDTQKSFNSLTICRILRTT